MSASAQLAAASRRAPLSARWACYRWSGTMPPDADRRNPHLPCPPLLLAEWVNKPTSMCAARYTDARRAVVWLMDEVIAHAERIRPHIDGAAHDEQLLPRLLGLLDHTRDLAPQLVHRCAFGPCDVLCELTNHNRIVHWQQPLVGGEVVWAIVGDRAVQLSR